MAARGIAVTGCTGEDYAISFENAIVTETDDPDEIVGYLLHLGRHPEEQERIRCAGFRTAEQFLWDQVIENLISKLEFLARKQNIVLK
jgi:glycosyltransferase involved in cell wall biosynthesis